MQSKYKRLRYSLAVLVSILLNLTACDNESVCTMEDVKNVLNNYFSMNYLKSAECSMQNTYNNLDDSDEKKVQVFLQQVKVNQIQGGPNNFTVDITYPDINAILEDILLDDGFKVAYDSMILQQADDKTIEDLVWDYIVQDIKNDEAEKDSTLNVVIVESDTGYELENDSAILSIISEYLSTDVMQIFNTTENSDNSENTLNSEISGAGPFSINDLTTVDSDKSFMYSANGARLLVKDINVSEGDTALSVVQKLSSANSEVYTTDKVYYIAYTVENLSKKKVVVENSFKAITAGGEILQNAGSFVYGLVSAAELDVGESVVLSTFIVCEEDSDIVWYNENISGCYLLNVVQ